MGVVPIAEALEQARQDSLDLVEVAPDARPPVCRIMDHGKQKFKEEKQRRQARKRETSNKLRLIRLRPNIGDHDFDVKMRKLRQLLLGGERCRVAVLYRRREMRHTEGGILLLDRAELAVEDIAKAEGRTNDLREGREIGMTVVPDKAAVQRAAEERAASGAPPLVLEDDSDESALSDSGEQDASGEAPVQADAEAASEVGAEAEV